MKNIFGQNNQKTTSRNRAYFTCNHKYDLKTYVLDIQNLIKHKNIPVGKTYHK